METVRTIHLPVFTGVYFIASTGLFYALVHPWLGVFIFHAGILFSISTTAYLSIKARVLAQQGVNRVQLPRRLILLTLAIEAMLLFSGPATCGEAVCLVIEKLFWGGFLGQGAWGSQQMGSIWTLLLILFVTYAIKVVRSVGNPELRSRIAKN